MHQVGGGFDQTHARAAGRAPMQKRIVASREVGLEVIQSLRATIVTEGDLHAFGRTVDKRCVENGATESRKKNVKNRNCSAKIAVTEFRFHFLSYKIVRDQ